MGELSSFMEIETHPMWVNGQSAPLVDSYNLKAKATLPPLSLFQDYELLSQFSLVMDHDWGGVWGGACWASHVGLSG